MNKYQVAGCVIAAILLVSVVYSIVSTALYRPKAVLELGYSREVVKEVARCKQSLVNLELKLKAGSVTVNCTSSKEFTCKVIFELKEDSEDPVVKNASLGNTLMVTIFAEDAEITVVLAKDLKYNLTLVVDVGRISLKLGEPLSVNLLNATIKYAGRISIALEGWKLNKAVLSVNEGAVTMRTKPSVLFGRQEVRINVKVGAAYVKPFRQTPSFGYAFNATVDVGWIYVEKLGAKKFYERRDTLSIVSSNYGSVRNMLDLKVRVGLGAIVVSEAFLFSVE